MSKKPTAEKPDANKGEEPAPSADANLLAVSRALADPTRLELLRRIAAADVPACLHLREAMQLNPATLSHHIRQLEEAGLIESRRDGKLLRVSFKRKAWKNYVAELKEFTD